MLLSYALTKCLPVQLFGGSRKIKTMPDFNLVDGTGFFQVVLIDTKSFIFKSG
jgi:hypothetical protein